MVIICFAFIIVIILVYLPYDLRKKQDIWFGEDERTVYRGVTTSDFSNLRYYSRGKEVELNSIILDIPWGTMGKKLKRRQILAQHEKAPLTIRAVFITR